MQILLCRFIVAILMLPLLMGYAQEPEKVALTIDPGRITGQVDKKVYGHFLEHIFHSVNGGLWGEMVWNRSFEESHSNWSLHKNGSIEQSGLAENVRLVFGDPTWKDYDLTLEASKTDGEEGFLILFRVAGKDDFYWLNFGGWGNTRSQLEKSESGQGRWSSIGPSVPKKVANTIPYRIRVRCEGPRIQVWFNYERIIDFTDKEHPHLSGRVGIGTWKTKAKFRDIRVTSLDGSVLFSGNPKIPGASYVAKSWKTWGDGRVTRISDNPLNSKYCLQVDSEADGAGVVQTPFFIKKNEIYHGSLWVRGNAPGGLFVRFKDGDKTIGDANYPTPGGQWRELKYQIRFPVDVRDAAMQIGVRGKGTVWIDQVSLMPASASKAGGFRPDLLQAVAGLKPPVIRWPGGCFASAYRWKSGIGPQHDRVVFPQEIWGDQDVNSYGTDEFIAMCHRVGAEPMIVVNAGSWDYPNQPRKRAEYLEEVAHWMEYCNGPATSPWGKKRAENGHPEPYGVKYWEIDNETWAMGAQAYVRMVRDFAPVMREIDPNIKLAACGSGGFNTNWNRAVINGCADLIDYISIHHYEAPERFDEGVKNYERFIKETGELIAGSANPDMKIYVSEWNAQTTDWRTGLYAGGMLNAFERCSDVLEIGGPALFLRHISAKSWDNAFINFNHQGWFPAPNYVVMKMWRESYAANRVAIKGDTGPLNAVATASEDGDTLYLKAVNPTDHTVGVELNIKGNFMPGSAELKLIAPGALNARNTLEEPNAIHPVKGVLKQDGRTLAFTLPRWSAGVVVIKM
jgi:alpha-L-arabinofuranosidase